MKTTRVIIHPTTSFCPDGSQIIHLLSTSSFRPFKAKHSQRDDVVGPLSLRGALSYGKDAAWLQRERDDVKLQDTHVRGRTRGARIAAHRTEAEMPLKHIVQLNCRRAALKIGHTAESSGGCGTGREKGLSQEGEIPRSPSRAAMRTEEHGRTRGEGSNEPNRLWAAAPTQFRLSMSCQGRESGGSARRGDLSDAEPRNRGLHRQDSEKMTQTAHQGGGSGPVSSSVPRDNMEARNIIITQVQGLRLLLVYELLSSHYATDSGSHSICHLNKT